MHYPQGKRWKGCSHKLLVETDAGTQGHSRRGEIFSTSPTDFDCPLV